MKPKNDLQICATVVEADTEAVLARMSDVAEHCGWIELRLDGAPELDLERIVAARPRPLVVTNRPTREGGISEDDDAPRLKRLARAAELGAEAIDVEWDAVDSLGTLPEKTQLIVSRHAFEPTPPEDFEALLGSVRHPRATIQKLAVAVGSSEDSLRLLQLAAAEARPTLAIAMGFRGVVSRLAGPRFGAPFTYAAADPHTPAAPGQLSAQRLCSLLAGRTLSPSTELYGVLGSPVAHSRSPELMNGAFRQLNVDAVYSWLETDDPAALLHRASADPGVRGFSVTIPHKVTCVDLDGVVAASEVAALGALNTLVRTDAGWSAHNTDALAASALLRAALPSPPGAHVAVLGNGGAARAIAWSARELGCRVSLFARSPERAARLASELSVGVGGALEQVPTEGLAAIVNATSVGMTPDVERSPVAPAVFNADVVAYDLVYTPADTRFLREARAAGSRTVSGLDHFLAQARAQLRLWLGDARVAPLKLESLLSCAP